MSDLPIAYAVGIFVLGFVAGILVTSLGREFRRRPEVQKQEKSTSPAAVPTRLPITEPRPAQSAASVQTDLSHPAHAEPPSNPPAASTPAVPVDFAAEPVEKVSLNPIESLMRSVQASTLKEPAKPTSMAEEIDAILQEMLARSEFAGRTIRLRSLPDQSVEVLVDNERFSGVGEVNDPAARSLIQEAVAAWQRRSGLKAKD